VGVGATGSGVGDTGSGVGDTGSGVGETGSGVGATGSGVGETGSGVGATGSGVGETVSSHPHVMTRSPSSTGVATPPLTQFLNPLSLTSSMVSIHVGFRKMEVESQKTFSPPVFVYAT